MAKRLSLLIAALLILPQLAFAGSAYYPPGAYNFTTPAYIGTLTLYVSGGGGGGHGGLNWCQPCWMPQVGGDGTASSFGGVVGYGGQGGQGYNWGPGTYDADGVPGDAAGGDSNITGGGSAGGAEGVGDIWGSNGGNGGLAVKSYNTSMLPIGTGVYVSVGSGGAGSGSQSGYSGGSGGSGYVSITWTDFPPASCSVSLSPNPVNRGAASTLSWSSSNADSWVYINNVGYVGSSGATGVNPSSTTDYSCYAQGSGGSNGWHAATLTVYQPCSWNSGSVTNGNSVTAYQASTVAYNNTCTSQTRTCSNGTLSGSYQYASCSVTPAASCTVNGTTVASGQSATFYTQQVAPTGQVCSSVSQSRTCTNGTLSGSSSYQYGSCTCAPLYSCSGNTVTYTNASCSTATTAVCTAPNYCSPGITTCVSPVPVFNASSNTTGHLQVKPQIVPLSGTATVLWNVSNVSGCTVTGSNGQTWSTLSGANTTLPISQQTTFTLACTPYSGQTFTPETQRVNVVPRFQEQ